MTPGFWGHNFGWFLFTGILFCLLVFIAASTYYSSDSHRRRQLHRYRMRELRLRLEYASKGVDPEYTEMLEEKVHRETRE